MPLDCESIEIKQKAGKLASSGVRIVLGENQE